MKGKAPQPKPRKSLAGQQTSSVGKGRSRCHWLVGTQLRRTPICAARRASPCEGRWESEVSDQSPKRGVPWGPWLGGNPSTHGEDPPAPKRFRQISLLWVSAIKGTTPRKVIGGGISVLVVSLRRGGPLCPWSWRACPNPEGGQGGGSELQSATGEDRSPRVDFLLFMD